MSAVGARLAGGRAARRAPADSLTGTWPLVRFLLRRDRVKLPAWVGGIGVMMLYIVMAIPAAYGTGEDLDSVGTLFQQPVGRFMVGPGHGLDGALTLDRIAANGYGLYFLLLTATMSILLVARHTRSEEQSGRAELVRSGVVGRLAPLTATLVVAVVTNLTAALLVQGVMIGVAGFGIAGSLLFAAGLAATGLAFAGITAVAVQLTESSRAAAGSAGVVLGAAFTVRAVGDMAREGGNALSWASPLAWGQQTAPFVLDRWWPLVLSVLLAAVTCTVGLVLAARRDLGAGLRAVRPGRSRATPRLSTPLGLALRLQRGALVGWAVGMAVGGAVFGAYADALLGAAGDMPETLLVVFGGAEDVADGYLAYMALFMAYVVSMYAVLAVQSLRAEETGGRGEALLATPVSRTTWLVANVLVTAAGVVAVMTVTGFASGLAAAAVTGEGSHVGALTVAHLNQVPGVLVVLGLATLFLGVLPRAVRATWALIGYGLFMGTFAPMLDLPAVLADLSPYDHAARVPLQAVGVAPLIGLVVVAVLLAAGGVLGFRRRDLDQA